MSNHLIKIVEFTDPCCTWCWGSEPILRKLETYYREQVQIEFIMGGLVADVREFYDSYNNIGGDPSQTNQSVVKHWIEASERHGMPVQAEGFQLFSNEYPSTYPMNIAYKAAQFEDYTLADKFLRRMREAVAAEAIQANRTEKLIELAGESGLDIGKFLQHFTDGSAEKAFREDLNTTMKNKAQGFPSFLIQFGAKEVLLRGYQNFDSFKNVIDYLSDHQVQGSYIESTDENILSFIQKYSRVAPKEIQESFDLNDKQLEDKIQSLTAENSITVTPAGNGHFISIKTQGLSCNPDTGICLN
jgi:predicted DsbA family dithiol-disulfide isomerase